MHAVRTIVLTCLVAGCNSATPAKLVPLEAVPANVLDIARSKLPDVKFKQALNRVGACYEFRGQDATGKTHTITITSSGEVLEIE